MTGVLGSKNMQLSQEQINTAMKSPQHLREWLDASGRKWIVFNGVDLIDALPWPGGVETFMQVVMAYRDHRRGVWTGREETQKDPKTGKAVPVKIMKDESLETEELDRAIRYLVTEMMRRNQNWSLNNPAL
jgi:hypothetical protein